MEKSLASQNHVDNEVSLELVEIQASDVPCANEKKFVSVLEELEEIEKQLLIEKSQLLDTLDKWQFMFDRVTDKKSRLLTFMEEKLFFEQKILKCV